MMRDVAKEEPFYIGYAPSLPQGLKWFAIWAAVLWLGAMGLCGALLVRATDDPGQGHYVDGAEGVPFVGLVEAWPYPVLRVPAHAGQAPKTYLLALPGKQGAQALTETWAGQRVSLGGVALQRGDLDMLLVTDPVVAAPALPAPDHATPPVLEPTMWEMTGEICDGKCFAGAMKPGSGLAHKACANLCLEGGLPPVLVTREPVEGHTTFLLANAQGGPLDGGILNNTARPVRLQGQLEHRDGFVILRLVAGSVQVLP